MPKFYCEYCGIYLTHSSPSGRGQHAKGRKHINNRIEYYKQVIDDITKENQDKLKQMQGTQSSTANPQQLYPGTFQSMQQLPMLQQLQQLKAGGIQQVQISSNQQGGPGGAPPGQPPHPMLQPPFMNMPKGGPGMPPQIMPPPGSALPPLRPGQQPPLGPPLGMMPPNNMMPPPMIGGMKPMAGMPPMGPPGQFMPPGPGMMGPPHNMPPMGFQPPPHHLGGNPFNQQGMDPNKGGDYQNEDKQN